MFQSIAYIFHQYKSFFDLVDNTSDPDQPLKMKVLILFFAACLYLASASPLSQERAISDADYDVSKMHFVLKHK